MHFKDVSLLATLVATVGCPSFDPPACENDRLDGNETDIDCGGDCDPCAARKACRSAEDCASAHCHNFACAPVLTRPTNTPIAAASGGAACIGASTFCVELEPGSLSADTTVRIAQSSNPPGASQVLGSSAFDVSFSPEVTFAGEALLAFQLPPSALADRSVAVAYAQDDSWVFDGLSGQTHVAAANVDVVTATTTHFTTFAVVDASVCGCDVDPTCTVGCTCDPNCCTCDVDDECTAGCGCDVDCCGCDVDASCTASCACDPECAPEWPDIEVRYHDYEGPEPEQCYGYECWTSRYFHFGYLDPADVVTLNLEIANVSSCDGGCDACTLTIRPDARKYNLGLGWYNNPSEAFSLAGAATHFDIESSACSESGAVTVPVTFTAPSDLGSYYASLVIESNDPDEPVVVVQLSGVVGPGQPPYVTIGLGDIDPGNIQVDDRVHLVGDASDPDDPSNPDAIVAWSWEVTQTPAGVVPADLDPTGSSSDSFSFVVPAVGLYEITVTAVDAGGLFGVESHTLGVYDPDFRVVLAWEINADFDLHLTYVDQADLVCSSPYDCYYGNSAPIWFDSAPASQGPNPFFAGDVTSGPGQETVLIDQAAPGTYRVYAQLLTGSAASIPATVSATAADVPYVFTRALEPSQIWAVADVVVVEGSPPIVQEYPSDGAGSGAVAPMGSCPFDFP